VSLTGALRKGFLRWYPETFVILAHLGGLALCIWMERWDLFYAGLAFGIPSSLLFFDLFPGGRNYTVSILKYLLRL
jgi:hypothetical protein